MLNRSPLFVTSVKGTNGVARSCSARKSIVNILFFVGVVFLFGAFPADGNGGASLFACASFAGACDLSAEATEGDCVGIFHFIKMSIPKPMFVAYNPRIIVVLNL